MRTDIYDADGEPSLADEGLAAAEAKALHEQGSDRVLEPAIPATVASTASEHAHELLGTLSPTPVELVKLRASGSGHGYGPGRRSRRTPPKR